MLSWWPPCPALAKFQGMETSWAETPWALPSREKKNNELAGAHEFVLNDEPELLQKNVKL